MLMGQVTELRADLFGPHVGETFDLVGRDGRRLPIVLERLADRGGEPHCTMFSLFFVIPAGGPTEQGLYRLERDGLGTVDLLLVPVGRDGDAVVFEAAVNLLGSGEGGDR